MRGYFGIGIEHTKTEINVGTLWRTANNFGASFVFTIGKRYKKQSSDTPKTWKQIPLYHYDSLEELNTPYDCMLVGIELIETSINIISYNHPERAIYLLGAEDNGLSKEAIKKCQHIIEIPSNNCLNVATAGAIVMYDRVAKSYKSKEAL
jgi:tRNA G18 (ribose-2'-O)-methylase SpoU